MSPRYPLLALLVLALGLPVVPAVAQDGYPYSIMKPEPGSRAARKNKTPHATIPRETEPQETDKETVKPSPKQTARRGSSNPVYPTPLPSPDRYTPPTSRAVVNRPPAVPPSMYVPQTGQTLPNLPSASGGAETFQDRAARCSHQAGVYGPGSTGDRNSYVGGCINQ